MSDDRPTPEPEEAPDPVGSDDAPTVEEQAVGFEPPADELVSGEVPRTSKMALASAILSIMSVLLLFPLLGILGAGLGVVAINRIKSKNLGGLRWAITGLVVGILFVVVFSILVATGVIEQAKKSS